MAIGASALSGESSLVHIIVKKNEAEKQTFGINYHTATVIGPWAMVALHPTK